REMDDLGARRSRLARSQDTHGESA
ncbi:flagellar export protein FliJ, partial [Xanthomonas perforans]|nr:flagellar export protein FliJ [Xanthomonas perforans]